MYLTLNIFNTQKYICVIYYISDMLYMSYIAAWFNIIYLLYMLFLIFLICIIGLNFYYTILYMYYLLYMYYIFYIFFCFHFLLKNILNIYMIYIFICITFYPYIIRSLIARYSSTMSASIFRMNIIYIVL